MHNDHDLDLIAALVEGDLEDPRAAEDLVASCPECRQAYRAHLTIRQAIEAAPRPSLDDLERQRLRSSVWNALQTDNADSAAGPVGNTPWWYRIAPVAAAFVVVVGATAILSPADDAATFRTSGGAPAPSIASDGATEMAPADAYVAESAPDADSPDSGDDRLRSFGDFDEASDDLRQRIDQDLAVVDDAALECVPPELGSEVVAAEEAFVDGRPVWLVAYGTERSIDRIEAYSPGDCENLHLSE